MIVGRNEIRNDHEWEIYLNHLERNARFERDAVEVQKNSLMTYKEELIDQILKSTSRFNEEDLKRESVRTLERIQEGLFM